MSKYIPVDPEKWAEMVKAMAENRLLKAEVDRLQNNCDYLDQKLDEEIEKTAMLCGQVERLRKAGDALYESEIGYYGEQILENMKHHSGELCRNWNAAKEGKPSV